MKSLIENAEFDNTVLVAVDFDGTLTDEDRFYWPCSGLDGDAVSWVLKIKRIPGVETILWTCREGDGLAAAVLELMDVGVEFDYVNRGNGKRPDSRKLNADFYIDDKAYPGKVPWRRLYREIKKTARRRGWL